MSANDSDQFPDGPTTPSAPADDVASDNATGATDDDSGDRRERPVASAAAPRWFAPVGVIQGFRAPAAETRGGTVLRATGIPYAYAARHEVPEPLTELPFGSPFIADRPGPTCPQRPSPAGKKIAPHAQPREHDENCQHIAITVPDGTSPDAKLPVMVWIHGGANIAGGGDLDRFNPSQMAWDNQVIVVSITFRLGAYGFLGGGEDRADGVPPANLGLMDIQAGLEWVRDNIAAFGGDPEQITMFGQSAGADLILSLLVAAGADKLEAGRTGSGDVAKQFRPPFRRAILQSLPFDFLGGRGPMYDAMIDAAGPIDRDTSHEDIAAAEERATEAAQSFDTGSAMPWGVRYGAAPMPDESLYDDALAAIAPDIDVFVGHTPREAALFFHDAPGMVRIRDMRAVGPALFEAAVRKWTTRTYGGSVDFTKKWAAAGGTAMHYVLQWGDKNNRYRSAHTCDLPLLLGDENTWRDSILLEGTMWTDVHRDRTAMQAIWTQFAKTGSVAESVAGRADFLKIKKVSATA